MGRNWIIDVIADLQNFAQSNELPLLANELAKAKTVATVEIGTSGEGTGTAVWGEDADVERVFSQTGNG